MMIFKKVSKYLQIGLLLTFFLPFFPSGCKEGQTESVSDSIQAIEVPAPEHVDTSAQIDTLIKFDSYADSLNKGKIDSIIPEKSDKEETVSDKIIRHVPFLKILLKPNDKYSGIGYIIDVFWSLVTSFGIVLSLALWIIGLRLKIKGNKDFQILNIIGLILLYTTDPVMLSWLNDSKLWGYWFCLWWAVIMIVFDFGLILRKKITSV